MATVEVLCPEAQLEVADCSAAIIYHPASLSPGMEHERVHSSIPNLKEASEVLAGWLEPSRFYIRICALYFLCIRKRRKGDE